MDRGERRKRDIYKALRKKRIAREVYQSWDEEWEYYNNLHQYSKNKVHCSCPICSGLNKTNTKKNKGKGYGPIHPQNHFGTTNERKGKNWKLSDYKKILSMNEQLYEY